MGGGVCQPQRPRVTSVESKPRNNLVQLKQTYFKAIPYLGKTLISQNFKKGNTFSYEVDFKMDILPTDFYFSFIIFTATIFGLLLVIIAGHLARKRS